MAGVIGVLLNRRSGALRADAPSTPVATPLTWACRRTGPTVVHFSAEWCGPCARCAGWSTKCAPTCPAVAHVEIDMDANPAAARRLSVLSLPTTFIFDADGRQRYRAAGVPEGR